MSRYLVVACLSLLIPAGIPAHAAAAGEVSGELREWHAVSVTFDGPQSSETATPNPFSDYRLDVVFTGPSGQTYKVPGYFAADGNAGESGATSGNKWRVKFCPDAAGTWQYLASFVQGTKIAAQPTGGTSAGYFDGGTGSFVVAATDKPASGVDLRGKGKLEYVDDHYLRFRTGAYFIKSGSNIPETFLEYNDFDGTPLNLDYSTHVVDWRSGDPTWMSGKGKGIIGALNYLSGLGVNSMYFLTMNSHGDGKKAWPWTGADNYYNYDCSKLDQWDVVFSHMDHMGMMLHVILTETENESYFEVQELGSAGGFAPSRKIYYREMIARFGHHLAITWNIGEENGMDDASPYGAGNTTQQRKDAADYLRQAAYYKDNITVHNGDSGDDGIYAPLLGYPSLTGPEIQWAQNSDEHGKVLYWRNASNANGHRWVVSLDEPWTSQTTIDQFRIWDVWGAYLAGAGGCEFFQTGDANFDDFRTKEAFYTTVARARRFIEGHVPFDSMQPADDLLSGTTGYCLAAAGQTYLIYLPAGGSVSVDLTGVSGTFNVRWFDPRNGGALQNGDVASVTGGSVRSLGNPPNNPGLDWVVLADGGGGCPNDRLVYRDVDLDGYGDRTALPVDSCDGSVPAGYADNDSDCNDASATVHPDAPEVNDGVDNQCAGDAGFGVTDEISGVSGFSTAGDKTLFSWTPQSGATYYDVMRSTTPEFSSGCTLLSSSGSSVIDTEIPATGIVFYYLVRPSAPHIGSWGEDSFGAEETPWCGTHPAIAFVQHASKDAGTVSSSTLAFSSDNSAGGFLAVAIRSGSTTGHHYAVTDSRGNTYNQAFRYDMTGDTETVALYYAVNVAGGPNTVTITDDHTGSLRFAISEYANVATTNPLEGTPGVAEGSGTSVMSVLTTTSSNGGLILALISSSNGATVTATNGFTMRDSVASKLYVEDETQNTAGAIAATATLSPADAWAAGVAEFRQAP